MRLQELEPLATTGAQVCGGGGLGGQSEAFELYLLMKTLYNPYITLYKPI